MRTYLAALLPCKLAKLATVAMLAMVVGLSALTGCGSVYYSVNVSAATSRLEQARQMGAEQTAPFEYYFAREHLRQAQIEAAEASYGDAAGYAETAEMYAQKAIDLVQAQRRPEVRGGGAAK
jgi:Domain of unknown function (DUF4398)